MSNILAGLPQVHFTLRNRKRIEQDAHHRLSQVQGSNFSLGVAPQRMQASNFTLGQLRIVNHNGATSGFEMCFWLSDPSTFGASA